jgi:hypothetical protein
MNPSPLVTTVDDALRKREQAAQGAGDPADCGLWIGSFGVILCGGPRTDVLTLLSLNGVTVAHHPEVDVSFRVLGKPIGQPPLARDFDNRAVDVLVPVRDRLSIGHGLVANGGQPIAVSLDMSPDFVVATKRRGSDIVVGMEAVEVGAAQKLGVLRLQ